MSSTLSNSSVDAETATERFNDKTFLQGSIISGVAYGIQLTLFVMCFNALYRQCRKKRDKKAMLLLAYVTLGFILGTFIIMGTASMDQLSYVDNRFFPFGPALYEVVGPLTPPREMGNVGGTAADLLADALLVWRCITFYRGCGLPTWAVSLFPCLLYGATFAMGVVFQVHVSFPSSSVWALTTTKYAISYWSLSLSLNIIVTVAIVLRILVYRYHTVRVLGSQHGKQYLTIAAMIVESASLFSVMALIFLVTYVVNHPIQYVFGQVLSQIQIVAPMLIILRVAQGKAWPEGTGDMMESKANVRSPFVAEVGGIQTSSDALFSSRSRNGISDTVNIPQEALDNVDSESPDYFVKGVAN